MSDPLVPHEPVFLYFSIFYKPLTVTVVALLGTLTMEFINYLVFSFFKESKPLQNVRNTGLVKKLIALFNRAPLSALWVAGFTPIPFYPFRFLVVLADYPLVKYLLSVALSRGPRFFSVRAFRPERPFAGLCPGPSLSGSDFERLFSGGAKENTIPLK